MDETSVAAEHWSFPTLKTRNKDTIEFTAQRGKRMPWNPELPSFVRELTPYLQQYGYGAIFASIFLGDFGLLVPRETFLIAASLFAAAGSLKIQWVIAAGIVGAVLGDNVGYSIGHFGGCKLVLEHEHFLFLSKARWDKLEESLKQWGPSIVIVARFSFFYRDVNNL